MEERIRGACGARARPEVRERAERAYWRGRAPQHRLNVLRNPRHFINGDALKRGDGEASATLTMRLRPPAGATRTMEVRRTWMRLRDGWLNESTEVAVGEPGRVMKLGGIAAQRAIEDWASGDHGLRPRRDSGADVHTPEDFSQHAGHPIRLEYEQARRDGVVYTDWVLFVDERMLYLGQDARFVRQVLGQDFAAFIHEAFRRAGITTSSQGPRLAGDFDPDLRRAPAWPVASSRACATAMQSRARTS